VDGEHRRHVVHEGHDAAGVVEQVEAVAPGLGRQPRALGRHPEGLAMAVDGQQHRLERLGHLAVDLAERLQREQADLHVGRHLLGQAGEAPDGVLLAAADDAGHQPEQVDADEVADVGRSVRAHGATSA
jgi:hypothetical protein